MENWMTVPPLLPVVDVSGQKTCAAEPRRGRLYSNSLLTTAAPGLVGLEGMITSEDYMAIIKKRKHKNECKKTQQQKSDVKG